MRMALAVALLGGFVILAMAPPVVPKRSAFPAAMGWTETWSFSSVHATQAACADATRAFAISNGTVAVHDRITGRLLSEGTSPGTKHLNSGFIHDGSVWCAHSNYPLTPHESDVRVFDPIAGSLSVYHRFRDPPGSLVWCVRRPSNDEVESADGWWCCFAHYGAQNHRTVLIEYSNEGDGFDREVRRFTFPRSVIDDFDQMSASGGIWDGDTLLVSHHHFKVVYRLAIPEQGSELRLVEVLGCPFPGQGIAKDPTSGGLVGIDREKRAVVFARPVGR